MSVDELMNQFDIHQLEIKSQSLDFSDLKLPLGNIIMLFIVVLVIKALNSEVGDKYAKVLCFGYSVSILLQLFTIVYLAIKSCTSYMLSSISIISTIIAYLSGLGLDMSGLKIAGNMEIPAITTLYANLGLKIYKPAALIGICGCICGITGNSMSTLSNGTNKIIGWAYGAISTLLVAFVGATSKVVGSYGNVALKSAQLSMGTIASSYGKELGEISGVVFDSLNVIASTTGNFVLCSVLTIITIPLLKAILLLIELKILGCMTEELCGTKCISNAITSGTMAISMLLSISICTILISSSLCGIIERISA